MRHKQEPPIPCLVILIVDEIVFMGCVILYIYNINHGRASFCIILVKYNNISNYILLYIMACQFSIVYNEEKDSDHKRNNYSSRIVKRGGKMKSKLCKRMKQVIAYLLLFALASGMFPLHMKAAQSEGVSEEAAFEQLLLPYYMSEQDVLPHAVGG